MEPEFKQYVAAPEAIRLFARLKKEFAADYQAIESRDSALRVSIDSLYQRTMPIMGSPLNDSFHFGQTLVNDFGRPYSRGVNQIDGFEARLEGTRFSLDVRGEYQHAPGTPGYSSSIVRAISVMDGGTPLITDRAKAINSFRLINASISIPLAGHQISIGKSDMWWGPADGGAFTYSNNAAPIYMLRIDRINPLQLPLLSRVLGPVRYGFFVGKLDGHLSPPAPWIQGQTINFTPSPNFQFGFSRTIIFAGEGHVPLTFGSFWNSFSSFSNVSIATKFSRNDPGARYSGFNFSYRVPFLRNWLTVYTDSMAHDDVSPLSAPRRSAFRPGIYLSRVPRLPKVDVRVEAVYTDFPTSASNGGKFFFFENAYHDAYTNKQFILGDWIGRESKGGQAWLTYHLSPSEQIQAAFRHVKSASDFVPGGTTQNDYSVRLVKRLQNAIEMDATAQVELWKAPILAVGLQKDLALSVQLTYFPAVHWRWK